MGFFCEVDGGVIAVEDPGAEEDGDNPAVSVTDLLFGPLIDPVVEVLEDPGARLEAASLGGFDGELDPVHHDQDVKYHDGEVEVPLQDFLVDHVGRHGEEHPEWRSRAKRTSLW